MKHLKQHRGETLKKALEDLNLNKSAIQRKMGIGKRTLYNYFSYPDLSMEIINKVAAAANADFSSYFPDFKPYDSHIPMVQTSGGTDVWKDRYIELQKEYIKKTEEQLDSQRLLSDMILKLNKTLDKLNTTLDKRR